MPFHARPLLLPPLACEMGILLSVGKGGSFTWLVLCFFVYFQRGNNVPKVLVFSEEGFFLNAWNTTIEMPHGMFAVNGVYSHSLWITDVGAGR